MRLIDSEDLAILNYPLSGMKFLLFQLKEILDLLDMPILLNIHSEIPNFFETFRMLSPTILESLIVECKPP